MSNLSKGCFRYNLTRNIPDFVILDSKRHLIWDIFGIFNGSLRINKIFVKAYLFSSEVNPKQTAKPTGYVQHLMSAI